MVLRNDNDPAVAVLDGTRGGRRHGVFYLRLHSGSNGRDIQTTLKSVLDYIQNAIKFDADHDFVNPAIQFRDEK